MNDKHLNSIISNYIARFEELNDKEHAEYYKWQIAKEFKPLMDKALLESDDSEAFSKKLYEIRKMTENLIDSSIQPFYGLVKFAEKEPVAVKSMFKDLFSDDGGDIIARTKRINSFLTKSHSLRDKYFPGSYKYNDNFHSVTSYLFLYDPDHNYIFKATNALDFADCIEFYDDWGSGENVKLDVYYRMCDQIAYAVKNNAELMEIDTKRFSGCLGVSGDTMHSDPEKHILVVDLIYCCRAYGLFNGISYKRPNNQERQEILSRKEKAVELSKKLEEENYRKSMLEQGKERLAVILIPGTVIRHKKFGEGTIEENDGERITVEFVKEGKKKLNMAATASKGLIVVNSDAFNNIIEEFGEYLRSEDSIRKEVDRAEREFTPYAEYLE